jgi:Tfp pilus assembly protein PilV
MSPAAQHPARWRSARGVTIAEVAMAAMFMALVLTTSITALQRAFISLQNARDLNIVSQMLQSEMEKMRLADWSTVSTLPNNSTTIPLDATFTTNAFVGNRFALTRTVADPKTGTRVITLRINWTGADRRPLTRNLSLRYSRNGLYDYFYSQT